ncbi:unnamed protein product [Ambrosiozyma monospora]|uniref:Unnamed protein product n=1 Tax=Ambrosiozyma monospora TaxID=43982 RepID=A0ACB5SVG4_AMBMO|nr:unnamed protein product [Ambrosiozyma monospora]
MIELINQGSEADPEKVKVFINVSRSIIESIKSTIRELAKLFVDHKLSLEGKETLLRLVAIERSMNKAIELITKHDPSSSNPSSSGDGSGSGAGASHPIKTEDMFSALSSKTDRRAMETDTQMETVNETLKNLDNALRPSGAANLSSGSGNVAGAGDDLDGSLPAAFTDDQTVGEVTGNSMSNAPTTASSSSSSSSTSASASASAAPGAAQPPLPDKHTLRSALLHSDNVMDIVQVLGNVKSRGMSISDIFASGPGSSTNLVGLNNGNTNNTNIPAPSANNSSGGDGLSFTASGSFSGPHHAHSHHSHSHHGDSGIPNDAGAGAGDDDDAASIDSFDSMDAADELGDNSINGDGAKLVKEKSKVGESYDAVLKELVKTASGRLKDFE